MSGMKRNLTIGISLIVLVLVGFIFWITTPRYYVIKPSLDIRPIESMSIYRISPAEVEVQNLWIWRKLEIPIEVSNTNSEALCTIRPCSEYALKEGYSKLNPEEYRIVIFPTDFTNENYIKSVIITIEKLQFKAEPMQQMSYSFNERMNEESGQINVGRNYILDILIK